MTTEIVTLMMILVSDGEDMSVVDADLVVVGVRSVGLMTMLQP